MLIQFKVANYRSIGDEQIISFVPAMAQKEHQENILKSGKNNALNVLAFYGRNASGKSNLLNAMSLLDKMINESIRSTSTTKLPFDPFLLREGYNNKPTKLEITFVNEENLRYRYGFSYNESNILKEWLYRKSVGREVYLFEREGDIIDLSSGFTGSKKLFEAAIEATRDNALFLSTCDMLNIKEAQTILKWFEKYFMIDGLNQKDDLRTVRLFESKKYNKEIVNYLESLNLDLIDIQIVEEDFEKDKLPNMLSRNLNNELLKKIGDNKLFNVYSSHHIYNVNGDLTNKTFSWDFANRESSGTQKIFKISGPVIWALFKGGVLIMDEMEAAMHPIMTLSVIDLFLDPKTNPKKAQLIFATHDTNLLSYAKLRRDQICFAEKNKWESTELYYLSDFVYFEERNGQNFKSEKERPDSDKEKRYFEGRYGAIPLLGEFHLKMQQNLWPEEEN